MDKVIENYNVIYSTDNFDSDCSCCSEIENDPAVLNDYIQENNTFTCNECNAVWDSGINPNKP